MNVRDGQPISHMRGEWDQRAEENAFYYIASGKTDWDEKDFLESGERDVARLLDPVLDEVGVDPRRMTILEIGCGVGRMSQALARRFLRVSAVDISPHMIAQARALQRRRNITNIRFEVGTGYDLAPFADQSVDFCFSYIVFQHVPDFAVVRRYIMEIGRVLKNGGRFLFQVNGFPHVRLPGSVFLFWGVRETGRLRRVGIKKRPFIRLGRLDSWNGVPVRSDDVLQACAAARLTVSRITGAREQYMWFLGKKERESQTI